MVTADLNADGARVVAAEIESSGGTALAQVADLTTEDDVNQLVEATVGGATAAAYGAAKAGVVVLTKYIATQPSWRGRRTSPRW